MTQICCVCRKNKDCPDRNNCIGCEKKVTKGECPKGQEAVSHGYCPACFNVAMDNLATYAANRK